MSTETTTAETTITDQIRAQFGIEANYLSSSGDYSTGFWRNEVKFDLDALKDGEREKSFGIYEDIHDTSGQSFAEYHGLIICCTLPDGVRVDAIADLCAGIWERRAELTAGFSVEWENGDRKAVWDTDVEDCEEATQFWDGIKESVRELPGVETYDLADHENISFIIEALEMSGANLEGMDEEEVKDLLLETYKDDSDWMYLNADNAAEAIMESIAARG
jgi:hypothetical protein